MGIASPSNRRSYRKDPAEVCCTTIFFTHTLSLRPPPVILPPFLSRIYFSHVNSICHHAENAFQAIQKASQERSIFKQYAGDYHVTPSEGVTEEEWGWEKRHEKGRDPRIPAGYDIQGSIPPRPMLVTPTPKKAPGDIYFFQYHADWLADDAGQIQVALYGITSESQTVCVKASGFYPYLAIKSPGYDEAAVRSLVGYLNKGIRETAMLWGDKYKELLAPEVVVGYSVETAEDFWMFTGDPPSSYILLYFHRPKAVACARDLLRYARDHTKGGGKARVADWLPAQMIPEGAEGFSVYESEVDYIVSFFARSKLTPASWMVAPAGTWRASKPDQRQTRCSLEVRISHEQIRMADDEGLDTAVPPFRIMCWDIEALPVSWHFTTPSECPVLAASFIIADKGAPGEPRYGYVFALGYVPQWTEAIKVFCYDFSDERRMLQDIAAFRKAAEHQVETGYNTNGFDYVFMSARCRVLDVEGFDDYTYRRGAKARAAPKSRKGLESYTLRAPGVFTYDMLNHMREYEKFSDYKLGTVAAAKLNGETKEEFTYDMIAAALETTRGRTVMSRYCYTDSDLAYKLYETGGCLYASIQYARVFMVNMQDILDRNTEFKVIGRLMHYCKTPKLLGREHMYMIPTIPRIRKNKADEKYKGATVLTPLHGYYGRGGVFPRPGDLLRGEPATAGPPEKPAGEGSEVEYARDLESPDVEDEVEEEVEEEEEEEEEGENDQGPIPGSLPSEALLRQCAVLVLDFEGLYPSIIVVYNTCYTTVLLKKTADDLGLVEGEDYKAYYELDHITETGEMVFVPNDNPPCFLMPGRRKGVLPIMEEDLKALRGKAKADLKKATEELEKIKSEIKRPFLARIAAVRASAGNEPSGGWAKGCSPDDLEDRFVKEHVAPLYEASPEAHAVENKRSLLDMRQMAIKTYMNSIYGFTGAVDSALPMQVIATVICGSGRTMIQKAKSLAENTFRPPAYPFTAQVVYGDTDSIFVAAHGLEVNKETLKGVGALMAKEITQHFEKPGNLQFEKVYLNMLVTANKKMYAGRKVIVGAAEDVLEVKGFPFTKRGSTTMEKEVMRRALELLVMDGDIEAATEYLRRRLYNLYTGQVPLQDLVVTGSLRKGLASYPCMRPLLEVAIKYEDPMNPRAAGDSVDFVYVKKPVRSKASEKAEDPEVAVANRLPIDYPAYATKLKRQIKLAFSPVFGGDDRGALRRLLSGPHTRYVMDAKVSVAGDPSQAAPTALPNKITRYVVVAKRTCPACSNVVDAAEPPYAHPWCLVNRCRACDGEEYEVGPLSRDDVTGYQVCADCAESGALDKALAVSPWEDAKRSKSVDEVYHRAVNEERSWVAKRDECAEKCLSCVGVGNEARVDTCVARSCRWWRSGNQAVDMVNRTRETVSRLKRDALDW